MLKYNSAFKITSTNYVIFKHYKHCHFDFYNMNYDISFQWNKLMSTVLAISEAFALILKILLFLILTLALSSEKNIWIQISNLFNSSSDLEIIQMIFETFWHIWNELDSIISI